MADILSRDALLALRLRRESIEVPEWGGSVYVWELSALRRAELAPIKDEPSSATLARIVAACVGDDSGPVGFDVANLSGQSMKRLADAVIRLNVASPESLEEQRKNSSGGPTGASPTGSP